MRGGEEITKARRQRTIDMGNKTMSSDVDYSAITWFVDVFEKYGDGFIKEYVIDGISVDEIRRILKKNKNDSLCDTYPLNEEMLVFFQKYINENIDLSKYECFFGGCRK